MLQGQRGGPPPGTRPRQLQVGATDAQVGWTRSSWEAIAGHTAAGGYVNYMGHDAAGQIREAYGSAKFRRLVELKRRYDPANLFSLNQNIDPQSITKEQ